MRQTVSKRKRGFFGWIVAILFWGFHLLMVAWLISYLGIVGEQYGDAASEAAQAGTAIGGTIGTGMILSIWVFGTIILGFMMFFTRGDLVTYETDTVASGSRRREPRL